MKRSGIPMMGMSVASDMMEGSGLMKRTRPFKKVAGFINLPVLLCQTTMHLFREIMIFSEDADKSECER